MIWEKLIIGPIKNLDKEQNVVLNWHNMCPHKLNMIEFYIVI